MLEKRLFFNGLDSDTDNRLLANGDYRNSLNIRASKTKDSAEGAVEDVLGNELVSYTLPVGANKVIGSKFDKVNNRVFYFVQNTANNHSILSYSLSSNTIIKVMQDSRLGFSKDFPILHIDIVDNLLYWTDGLNEPRYINIDNAVGGIYTVTSDQYIDAIQWSPRTSPTGTYGSDLFKTYNNVRNTIFQFRYAFVYEDNQESAYSPISKIIVPESEGLYEYPEAYPVTTNNLISITFDTGIDRVKKIRLVGRQLNTGDWFLIKTFDKSEAAIQDNSTHTYNFYNDETYDAVDQTYTNRLYDYVPLKAECQSLIDGKRITYSNVTEGYDSIRTAMFVRPVYLPVNAVNTQFIWSDPNSPNTLGPSSIILNAYTRKIQDYAQIVSGNLVLTSEVNTPQLYNIITPGTGAGELFRKDISITVKNWGGNPTSWIIVNPQVTISHNFPTGSSELDIANFYAAQINGNGALNGNVTTTDSNGNQVIVDLTTAATVIVSGSNTFLSVDYKAKLVAQITYTIVNNNVTDTTQFSIEVSTNFSVFDKGVKKTFKRGANHPIGIVYRDKAGRLSTVQSNTDPNTFAEWFHATPGNEGQVKMQLTINHLAPSWAVKWMPVYAGNTATNRYIYIQTDTITSVGNEKEIEIGCIVSYNEQNGGKSALTYEYSKGDRIRFIRNSSGYFTQYEDVAINSAGINGAGNQYVRVDNSLASFVSGLDIVAEIYSPSKTLQEKLFYEIGEEYDVQANGFHNGNVQNQSTSQPCKVLIEGGDSYYRFRPTSAYSIFVEDFSFSDYFTSNSWDKGRPNRIDKDFKQIKRYTTSYYSEPYIPETNINGLSTIFDTSFESYDPAYGEIKRTFGDEARMDIFQQLKTGFVLVNKDVLFNADGTPQGAVGQSNVVLSAINYYAWQGGIGNNPESFAVFGNRRYFVDAANGMVCRLSVDGVTPISEYKQHNFFTNEFAARINTGRPFRVWGVYDFKFDEYILAFEAIYAADTTQSDGKGGKVTIPGALLMGAKTRAFSEDKKRWTTSYSYEPENMVMTSSNLITFKGGAAWKHESGSVYNNFYGVQYPSYIDVVFNEQPSNVKFFLNTSVESTQPVSCPTITNDFGQASELIESDFELVEGVYLAALLKDTNTPNVTNPLIEGDDLRCHSVVVRYQYNGNQYFRLFSVGMHHENSELTNR